MLIPPIYRLTPKIVEFLQSIEASREVVDAISIPSEVENNIRRQSHLKSSLFSARIEGNPLTLADLTSSSKTLQKLEVLNISKGLDYVYKRSSNQIKIGDILKWHEIIMDKLPAAKGKFRNEQNAIFNSAGIAVYMPPPPSYISKELERLLKYISGSKEKIGPIKACLAHFVFEKVHPFLDGNGRVGRLLLQKVLISEGYGMKGILAFEEYVDNHRSDYYRALEEPEKDTTDYLLFMLEAIATSARKTKELILQKQKPEIEDFMLPRRAEILRIIKDHRLMSIDQLHRRFLAVNIRTLRYDLKKLQDQNLIIKRGTTKGVYYQITSDDIDGV